MGCMAGRLVLLQYTGSNLFLFVPAAAAAHLAGSLPAAGAQQPAHVPTAASPPPAAAVPSTGLADARQQHPPEAPADLHHATAPACGPFPGKEGLVSAAI